MSEHVYKLIEVVGVSEDSIQQAVRNALSQAGKTVRNMEWFEVRNIRGAIHDKDQPIFQVTVGIGFKVEA